MDIDTRVAPIVEEAARTWGAHALRSLESVGFSSRLRTSAGRALPVDGIVRLHVALSEGPAELLREVVLHELAHLAVHRQHGRYARPHGREWKALLRAAGLEPRVHLPAGTLPAPERARASWLHTCPICRAARRARRPVRRWRCHRCHEAGLSGELTIERIGA